jgi:hypothetical protein
MKSKKLLAAAFASVACLFALGALWRQFSGPAVSFGPSKAAGEVLAEEVGRLLGGQGAVVVVGEKAPTAQPNAATESMASFAAALRRGGPLKLTAILAIPRSMLNHGVLTPEQMLEAMDKDPGAHALALFTGLPPYSPELQKKLKARSLTLVAVGSYDPNVRHWLESKTLALALVPRLYNPDSHTPSGSGASKTTRESFESEYQIVTPENIDQMPF